MEEVLNLEQPFDSRVGVIITNVRCTNRLQELCGIQYKHGVSMTDHRRAISAQLQL